MLERTFMEFCEKKNIQQRMNKARFHYDNVAMENFYGIFKSKFLNMYIFQTDELLNKR